MGNKVHRLSDPFGFRPVMPLYIISHSDVDFQVAWYRGHTWKCLSHAKFCIQFLCFLALLVGETYRKSFGSLAGLWPRSCSWSPN